MASQKQRQYDFETLPDRSGTGAQKWERYAGRDVIPAWVADMDLLNLFAY